MNTELLTDLPYTTTIDNKPTVTTTPVKLSVVTATAAAEGVAVGDVTVLMSEQFKDGLSGAIDAAVKACGSPGRKLRQRAVGADCELTVFIEEIVTNTLES